ncbi:hypothetical protein HPB50_004240 [Hyalomma asiaticum]|uniref:Uncharacterized protein n=1 Tax=Hyalomma asiaticum TaxID=266040 RepID=A0ACB7TEX3_HYAAI|nr:hypothetical protein HPB50_004240 [Hyalomma asiaticum]
MQRLTKPQQLSSTDTLLVGPLSSLNAGTSGPVLPTPSDATNLGRTALSQPAALLNCTHTTGHIRPHSLCSTIGTDRKLASAARPRNGLISVGTQLPPGTLTPKLPLYDLLAAIVSTSRLSPKATEEVTLQAKPAHSLVFLKTHSPLTANLLLSLSHASPASR